MTDDWELEEWGSGVQASVDSPSDATTQADVAPHVEVPSWGQDVDLDDEAERTHRKRGPKRGTGSNLPKRQRLATDAELEEHVAYSIGLDAYGMNEGESGLLADDTEEEAYYQVGISSSRRQQMQNPTARCHGPCRVRDPRTLTTSLAKHLLVCHMRICQSCPVEDCAPRSP